MSSTGLVVDARDKKEKKSKKTEEMVINTDRP